MDKANGQDKQQVNPAVSGFQLVITMNAKGGVNVDGPLQNKVLCYGLLEIARQLIQEYKKPEGPKVAVVGSMPGLHVRD